jgi:hypothetical protein
MPRVPQDPEPAKPGRGRARGAARPGNKRPLIAADVPPDEWDAWTDLPFEAIVGAIYVAALSEGGAL